jgi:hypothetical protein
MDRILFACRSQYGHGGVILAWQGPNIEPDMKSDPGDIEDAMSEYVDRRQGVTIGVWEGNFQSGDLEQGRTRDLTEEEWRRVQEGKFPWEEEFRFDTFRKSERDTNVRPIPESAKDADGRWVTTISTVEELLELSAREDSAIEIHALSQTHEGGMDMLVIQDAKDDD